MRVSDIVRKVRYELAEPTASEWKDDELVSYLNDGFASAWRLAAELHHPLVEQTDDVTILAEENSVQLPSPPLKMISVTLDAAVLPYEHPGDLPTREYSKIEMWTVEGLDTLRVWGTPAEETTLTVRLVREPDILRLEASTLTDDEVPMPSSVLELLVNFVIMKAQNRLGGRPQMEASLYQQYKRDVMRALEIREPPLVTCNGYWIPAPKGW